jgi:hypothetical protein
MRIVESTTADASARVAALVALRSNMTDEERPRIRVAAERCVLPSLRDRMVRVVDAEDDEVVASVLAEVERA